MTRDDDEKSARELVDGLAGKVGASGGAGEQEGAAGGEGERCGRGHGRLAAGGDEGTSLVGVSNRGGARYWMTAGKVRYAFRNRKPG